MPEPIAKILIVDDEVAQMRALCDTLEFQGYATTGFASPRAALATLECNEYDVVLTDLKMPEMDGIELLATAQKIDPNLVGVVMTGHGTVDSAVDAMKAGSMDYVLKPFKLGAISAVLTRALAARRLRMENLELKEAVSIYDLSMSLTSVLDSRVVPQRVADAAMQLPHAAGACVLVMTPEGQDLEVGAVRGNLGETPERQRMRLDARVADWVARARDEMSKPTWQTSALPTEHPLPGLARSVAVPMCAAGKLLGILCFSSSQIHRSVRVGQIKALTILANTAATSMDAARLVEEIEERVDRRTSELKIANEELDAFSHSVSHDLRAPLRAIAGYTQVISEDYAPHLPQEAKRLFEQIHAGAMRMQVLIEDLLDFARFSREPIHVKTLDMQALALEVWHEQVAAAQSSSAQLQVLPLPACEADPSLLRQVWTNLLSNALKYSRHRDPPRIEIGASQTPGAEETTFFVRDNGAGFDMQHAHRLFGVFQRLHDASQFEGTGIGLSIVRRIIARHGGRVWAEGQPGQGASFYFTLPRAANA